MWPNRGPAPRKANVPNVLIYYLKVVSRLLHLQALSQAIRWLRPDEEPKVALHHNRYIVILHSLIHVCPLVPALYFIVLNIKGTLIGNFSSVAITAMQFAAKLLEILIQISLSTMLLGLIRGQVLAVGNVPFGCLTAPLSSTRLSYLWSVELWGSLTSNCLRGWRKTVLSISIPAVIFLAALVGPSSAILMIPRQIRYPGSRILVFLDNKETLFPSTMNSLPNDLM